MKIKTFDIFQVLNKILQYTVNEVIINSKCIIIVILCLMNTVIGLIFHEIEILVNTLHMYSLYGLPIIEIPSS